MKPQSASQPTTAGVSHKYRVELPNLIDEMRLSPFEVALYVHVKRRAGDDGVCKESARELAEACRMSLGQITAAKKELVTRGLIEVRRVKRQDVIFICNIWQENYDHFAPHSADERSPSEQIVHRVNRSFTTRTDRSPSEQIVHLVNVPPDPLNRIEEPLQEPSERTIQELSLSPRASDSPNPAGDEPEREREIVSSFKTKYTLEQIRSCAAARGMGDGWVTTARRTGEHDWQVEEHLNPPLPMPPTSVLLDAKQCPDCEGRNYYYPAGYGVGSVAKCPHARLLGNLRERAEREANETRGSPPVEAVG